MMNFNQRKDLWIILDEGFAYFDCKEVSDILENPKPADAVTYTLVGNEVSRYEKYVEEQRYWQARFAEAVSIDGDKDNESEA